MTQLATANSSAIQYFDSEQMKVLQEQLAPKCTASELQYFIEVCKTTGLSPFTREIYAISRNNWNSETGQSEPKMTIQVSIDGLRKRAANTGLYDGSITYWCGKDGQWREVWLESTPPAAAKTIVYRKGASHPFVAVARFDAYKQEFKGKLSGLWAKMPDIMIGKCSEALALRKTFPEQTAGLYASEEMDQADNSPQSVAYAQTQVIESNFWEPKLFDKFLEFAAKVDSFEKLQKLTDWVSRQPNPSNKQSVKISEILSSFRFESAEADLPLETSVNTDDYDDDF